MVIEKSPMLSDEEVIKSFPLYGDAGTPDFITNFLGVKTRTRFHAFLATRSGDVEGYPIPANFHATDIEWAGVLRAVLDADSEIVAVELGAAWAPMA